MPTLKAQQDRSCAKVLIIFRSTTKAVPNTSVPPDSMKHTKSSSFGFRAHPKSHDDSAVSGVHRNSQISLDIFIAKYSVVESSSYSNCVASCFLLLCVEFFCRFDASLSSWSATLLVALEPEAFSVSFCLCCACSGAGCNGSFAECFSS